MVNFVKELSGHSGCRVCIVEDKIGYFVKKTACNANYNSRLRIQCAKQILALKSGFLAPKIVDTFMEDSRFGFCMEYISGETLAEYIEKMPSSEISGFIDKFFDSLDIECNSFDKDAASVFKNKIKSLEYLEGKYPNLSEAFYILNKYDWKFICRSPCHGDLTLENIIITPEKKLYLIDFLDSFYNSWEIDLAKILQDLELKWSYRSKLTSKNRDINLLVAKEFFKNKILTLKNGQEILSSCYYILMLNLIRVYPYLKDLKTKTFLDNAIEKLIRINKEGCKNENIDCSVRR